MLLIFPNFQSIIYYTIRSPKLQSWLTSPAIEDALQATQDRSFVDLDPIFNHNLDEDFDFRASGITRASFCSVYLDWIQFCYKKRVESHKSKHTAEHQQTAEQRKPKSESQPHSLQLSHSENFDGAINDPKGGISPKSSNYLTPSPLASKSDRKNGGTAATASAAAATAAAANAAKQNVQSSEIVSTQVG